MTCPLCKRENKIKARGLCSTCYESERVSGNLGSYTDHRRNGGLTETVCGQCGKVFHSYSTTFGPRKYCSRHCYEISERVLDQQIENQIVETYLSEGISATKISKKYSVSHTTVLDLLIRNGVTNRPGWSYARKYTTNEHAFDDLDNEAAAYWLGFIYADGYVRRDSLQVVLKASDLPHLVRLSEFMQSSQVARPNKTKGYCISFHGLHLTETLIDLGIVTKRGYFGKVLAKLPYGQFHHFIRGYLDGDGYISATGAKSRCNVGFCGQDDILAWIKQILSENCPQIGSPQIRPRRGIKELCFGGHRQASSIIKWLYKDATIYLLRKHERAIYWMAL